MRRIRLEIDSLALQGVRSEDRREVAAGVEHALRNSLGDPSALDRLRGLANTEHTPRLVVRSTRGGRPGAVGEAIGRAIAKEAPK